MKRAFLVILIALTLQACASVSDLGDSISSFVSTPNTNTVDEKEVVQSEIAPVYQEGVLISSGYANISAQSSDNPSQRRLMAIRASKIDAYRNLTERVYGQSINASTTVEDMVATNDAVRAHVQGLIYGARLVSIEPIGGDSYETRLELSEKRVNEIRNLFLFK
jgi:hypothetical protein